MSEEIAREAAAIEMPDDLENLVQELLNEDSELSWDEALAQLIL